MAVCRTPPWANVTAGASARGGCREEQAFKSLRGTAPPPEDQEETAPEAPASGSPGAETRGSGGRSWCLRSLLRPPWFTQAEKLRLKGPHSALSLKNGGSQVSWTPEMRSRQSQEPWSRGPSPLGSRSPTAGCWCTPSPAYPKGPGSPTRARHRGQGTSQPFQGAWTLALGRH